MNRKLICFILLFALVSLSASKQLKPNKIIKAINCGLKQGTTNGDVKYESDQTYVSGSSVDVDYHSDSAASAADIKYTIEKEIYMFERHTYSQMTYTLPVKSGKNTIILKFAEMYFSEVGKRVFDIKLGDTIIIQNMDVIQKAGSKYAAHQQFIEIQIKDAAVYYNNNKISDGLKAGKITLSFVKGKADNPIIQGIIVYHDAIQQSSKQQYESLKKNWGSHQQMLKAKKDNEKIKEMISMTKKKEKILIRNDQLLIEEDHTQEEGQKRQKFGSIRSFLMNPIGILIWAGLIFYKIYFVYNKLFLFGKPRSKQDIKQE